MINYAGAQYLLDTKDLYTEYGFVVTSGKADFLRFPKAKERYSYSWPDENGTEYDLDEIPVFEDPIAVLSGYLLAETEFEFLSKRYQFFADLRTVGLKTLKVIDTGDEFDVFYLDNPTSEVPKGFKVKGTTLKAWKIEISLQTVNYTLSTPISPDPAGIYYGPSTVMPTTESQVLALTSIPYSSTVQLNTGTTMTWFNIVLPVGRNIVSVTDIDAGPFSDVTALYTFRSNITIDSVARKIISMQIAVPYSTNHRHNFILS